MLPFLTALTPLTALGHSGVWSWLADKGMKIVFLAIEFNRGGIPRFLILLENDLIKYLLVADLFKHQIGVVVIVVAQ